MAQTFNVTNISKKVPHDANQLVRSIWKRTPYQARGPNTIYDNNGSVHPTAFKIVHDEKKPSRICVPLTITGQMTSPVPEGTHYVIGTPEVDDFRLTSHPFNLNGDNEGEETATTSFQTPDIPAGSPTPNRRSCMFYCEGLDVHCPFKVTGSWIWKLYRSDDNSEVAVSNPTKLDMYFFLGSTALPGPNIHVQELIHLTIPDYGIVTGKSWDQVESRLVTHISRNLWRPGGVHQQYDIENGEAQYLKGNTFQLGAMLRREHNRCNCFDLAAFVYTAFKSLGRKADGEDIFDITIHYKRDWGYIRIGTLYGWASNDVSDYCNNPFPIYREPSAMPFLSDKQRITWSIDPMHRDRRPFGVHCFPVFRSGNPPSEKVIDLCHVLRDPNGQLLIFRDDGCPDLQTYLSWRDVGHEVFQDDELRGTYSCLLRRQQSAPRDVGLLIT